MNSATEQPNKVTRAQLAVAGLALLALWFVLCRQLSGEWSVNEQYSYGWFVPFFAAFLFWLRWEDRPAADRGGRRSQVGGRNGTAVAIAIAALLILFPVRLFEVANPDWRPLNWVHTAAVVTLTFIVLWGAGGLAWVRHFAFPVLFFFVAVPWISPIEEPTVQGLMRVIAAMAAETITLFGIPAQLEGSLIRVNTGLVGVNEACSGVRSLQTSLMIGLLFGELKRLSTARRCLLVLGALIIALIANFGRALFLVWIAASKGVAAVAEWHDIAGYAIVAVVFLGSLLLSALLSKSGKLEVGDRRSEVGKKQRPTTDLRLPTSAFVLCLVWLLAVEISVEFWYRSHEKNLQAVGTWNVRAPEKAPGFREVSIDEEVRRTLRFDEGREFSWKESGLADPTSLASRRDAASFYLFFFRWYPGTSTILRARAHRPDVCLPSTGWRKTIDNGVRTYKASDDLSLAFRHFTFERDSGARSLYAHAFFCLGEDKINPTAHRGFDPSEKTPTDWMPVDRWRVVREGLRNPGQQVMQLIVVTPDKIEPAEAEARFAAGLSKLVERK